MLTTIVDKNYLYKYAKYLIKSAARYMPEDQFYLFVVNADESIENEVKSWHPNIIIDYRKFNVPENKYIAYMYVMMTFVFDWLYEKTTDKIIYLDADTILRGSINELYSELDQHDLMFRYLPFQNIPGPTSGSDGAKMNNGCIAIATNDRTRKYAKLLRNRILDYLDSGQDPIRKVDETNTITCIDQEFLYTTYRMLDNEIKFFPLDDKYNDSYFNLDSKVWHAKGVARQSKIYINECNKYKDELVNYFITKLYSKKIELISLLKKYRNRRKLNQIQYFPIITNYINAKDIAFIDSDLFLDNILNPNIKTRCYDIRPNMYFLNKNTVNVEHNYIDSESVMPLIDTDILVIGDYYTEVIKKTNFKIAIIKTNSSFIKDYFTYRISNEFIAISPIEEIINGLQSVLLGNIQKNSLMLYPEWTHYLRDIEIDEILKHIPPSGRILEIGSGDGYMASIIKQSGYQIIATDLVPRYPQYMNVLTVDSQKLPFNDKSFDIIVSSNVLEHIPDVEKALLELRRVLKDDGIMVHTMPSPTTMYMTILSQPIAYLRNFILLIQGFYFKPIKKLNILNVAKVIVLKLNPYNLLWGYGHGIYTRFECLYKWRSDYWKSLFKANNIKLKDEKKIPMVYSLHKLFPFRLLLRKIASSLGISSVSIYILNKGSDS